MNFCLPHISQLIDWSKGWEFLDKELQAVSKGELAGTRLVDKLVKVFLTNGKEQWLLLHIDVQGRREEKFPERMFIYGYRLYDKFQQPIISCAILTDESKRWRPSSFEVGAANSRLRIDYLVVKFRYLFFTQNFARKSHIFPTHCIASIFKMASNTKRYC